MLWTRSGLILTTRRSGSTKHRLGLGEAEAACSKVAPERSLIITTDRGQLTLI